MMLWAWLIYHRIPNQPIFAMMILPLGLWICGRSLRHQLSQQWSSLLKKHAIKKNKNHILHLVIGSHSSGKKSLLTLDHAALPSEHFILWKHNKEALHWSVSLNSDLTTAHDSMQAIDPQVIALIKHIEQFATIPTVHITCNLRLLIEQHDDHIHTVNNLGVFMAKLHDILPHANMQLILTQCDLISGFSTFFQHINIKQPWGFALSYKDELETLHQCFDRCYQGFIDNLSRWMLRRICQEHDPYQLQLIEEFPKQVAQIKQPLARMLKTLISQTYIPLTHILFVSVEQSNERYDYLANNLNHLSSTVDYNLNRYAQQIYFANAALMNYHNAYECTNQPKMGLKNYFYMVLSAIAIVLTLIILPQTIAIRQILKEYTSVLSIPSTSIERLAVIHQIKQKLRHNTAYTNGLFANAKWMNMLRQYERAAYRQVYHDLTHTMQKPQAEEQSMVWLAQQMMLHHIPIDAKIIEPWIAKKNDHIDYQDRLHIAKIIAKAYRYTHPKITPIDQNIDPMSVVKQMIPQLVGNHPIKQLSAFGQPVMVPHYLMPLVMKTSTLPWLTKLCQWSYGSDYQNCHMVGIKYLSQIYFSVWMQMIKPQPSENTHAVVNQLKNLIAHADGHHWQQQFSDAMILLGKLPQLDPSIQATIQIIGNHDALSRLKQEASTLLKQWQHNPINLPNEAFDYVKSIFAKQSGHSTYQASPLRLKDLILYGIKHIYWSSAITQANIYLNEQWQNRVLSYYQTHLKSAFPTCIACKQDASIADVDAFFKPTGILNTFYHQYLDAFINHEQTPWTWKRHQGLSITHNQQALMHVMQGLLITTMFYGQTTHLDFNASLKSVYLNDHTQSLLIDDNEHHYQINPHQHQQINLNLGKEHGKLSLTFFDPQLRHKQLLYSGPWALLRLLHESKVDINANDQLLIELQHDEFEVDFSLNTQDPYTLKALLNGYTMLKHY